MNFLDSLRNALSSIERNVTKELESRQWELDRSRETNKALQARLEASEKAYADLLNNSVKALNDQHVEMMEKLSAERRENEVLQSMNRAQGRTIADLRANLKAMEEYAVKVQNERDQIRKAAASLRPGEVLIDRPRITQAELLHQFNNVAFNVLKIAAHMTNPAVAALQYGAHHGHRRLHDALIVYRRWLDQNNKQGETLEVIERPIHIKG